MYKRFALLLTLLAVLKMLPAGSQNLVPNYSFEQFNACPTALSGFVQSINYNYFPYVPAWVSASAATPDYMNSCSPGTVVGVPQNSFGYQYPHTGNAYAGAYMSYQSANNQANTYTEDIEAQLTQLMAAGHDYHVQFYCVSSAHSQILSYSNSLVGIDKIGAVFTNTQINGGSTMPLSYTPSVSSPAGMPITDTANWIRVSGIYTANGGEHWITLGHFEDGLPITESIIIPGTGSSNNYNYSYYYFDDVMVKDVQAPDVVNVHYLSSCTAAGVILSGPISADEYGWSDGSTGPAITVNTAGTWWVRSWKDTVYSVDTFHVSTGNPMPLHLPADTNLCNTLPYTITPNYSYNTYSWSNGAVSPSITVAQSGQYILAVTDACGLQKDTINVFVRQPLHLANDTTICAGKTITVTPNHAYAGYSWSTGATTASTSLSQSGQYILSVTDVCGIQKDTIGLTVRPAVPPPTARDTTLCIGTASPQLQAAGDSLRWYSSISANSSSFAQPLISTATAGSQTFFLTQTEGGCESSRQPVMVDIIEAPAVNLGPDTTLCKDQALLLGDHYPLITTLVWSTGQTHSPLPVYTTGYYALTASNMCGRATDGVFVSFEECDNNGQPITYPPIRHDCLGIPSAFTPNNDGRNDQFRILNHCPLEQYSIRIFNRWGALVYESRDISVAWDGSYKGKPAAADTYFYLINYLVAKSGNIYDVIKGDVLLIR